MDQILSITDYLFSGGLGGGVGGKSVLTELPALKMDRFPLMKNLCISNTVIIRFAFVFIVMQTCHIICLPCVNITFFRHECQT